MLYLRGKLDSEEEAAFKQQLEADAALAKEVEFHRQVFEKAKEGAFLAQLSAIHEQKKNEGLFKYSAEDTAPSKPQEKQESGRVVSMDAAPQAPHQSQWFRIAAAVSLLLVAAFVLYMVLQPNPAQQIAQQVPQDQITESLEATEGNFGLGNIDPELLQMLKDAMSAYQMGHYREAAEKLTAYTAEREIDYLAKYYLAVCHIQLEAYQQALPLLKEVETSAIGEVASDAALKLAAVYMLLGNEGEAQAAINRIMDTGTEAAKEKAAKLESML